MHKFCYFNLAIGFCSLQIFASAFASDVKLYSGAEFVECKRELAKLSVEQTPAQPHRYFNRRFLDRFIKDPEVIDLYRAIYDAYRSKELIEITTGTFKLRAWAQPIDLLIKPAAIFSILSLHLLSSRGIAYPDGTRARRLNLSFQKVAVGFLAAARLIKDREGVECFAIGFTTVNPALAKSMLRIGFEIDDELQADPTQPGSLPFWEMSLRIDNL